jgi:hypothetical protein
MKAWLYLGGAIAAMLLLAGVYWFGRGDGQAIEQAKQAAVERAIAVERAKREDVADQVGAGAAQAEVSRSTITREITHEIQQVAATQPLYRNVCIDPVGVHLLDQAADVANGEDPGLRPAGAGEAAQGPAAP